MGIIERLDARYVDVPQLVGKTIAAAATLGQYDLVLRFADGTWCHTLPDGCQTLGVLEKEGQHRGSKHAFIALGLATESEIAGHWRAREEKYKQMVEANELELYARLKAKFERTV